MLNVIEVGLLRKIRMDFVHASKGSICLLPRKYSLLWGRVEQYAKRFFFHRASNCGVHRHAMAEESSIYHHVCWGSQPAVADDMHHHGCCTFCIRIVKFSDVSGNGCHNHNVPQWYPRVAAPYTGPRKSWRNKRLEGAEVLNGRALQFFMSVCPHVPSSLSHHEEQLNLKQASENTAIHAEAV